MRAKSKLNRPKTKHHDNLKLIYQHIVQTQIEESASFKLQSRNQQETLRERSA